MTEDTLYRKEKQEMARDAIYAHINRCLDKLVADCLCSNAASVFLCNKKDVVGLIREVLRREFNE